jgi:hypothetical protein
MKRYGKKIDLESEDINYWVSFIKWQGDQNVRIIDQVMKHTTVA